MAGCHCPRHSGCSVAIRYRFTVINRGLCMTTEMNKETRGFETEAKQLLQLMIHSLYSNKEVFLRELISNASDAADKLRFEALSRPDIYEGDAELKVIIDFDKEAGTLSISDNGIGMTRDEVISNL